MQNRYSITIKRALVLLNCKRSFCNISVIVDLKAFCPLVLTVNLSTYNECGLLDEIIALGSNLVWLESVQVFGHGTVSA